ncbi:hypothetical protein BJ878DRAFT_531594 [Calycina marina]|uniref:C2H2-type domain-containing protein n=1 Tax=Calycina marina TaxID=1763456 RepID=A0A9P8CJC1_9HELO|nr:hypothetical protein BJ878DRAFT_531594 [Calycina marina]
MGQSSFFYYNPDPKADNRQHGHFSTNPANVQMPVYHPHQQQYIQTLPSTPIYSRPNSAGSQQPMHPQMYNNGYYMSMTPVASPRPIYQKPTILIQEQTPRVVESNAQKCDMYYYPSTPPLSASGSSTSSPSSCEIVYTPMNTVFYGSEAFEGVKEGCEGEVQSENLAAHSWVRRGSPPITPVFIHPNSLMSNASPNELLSATSCPSLSPSPSPYPQQDYCDPRDLTVVNSQTLDNTPLLTLKSSSEFHTLPTLCAGDEEEHKYMLFSKASESQHRFDFSVPQHNHGLPAFDQFSELDSEDDFVNGLVNFPATDSVQFFGAKRQRTGSDLASIEHETFISEDDFDGEFEDFEDTDQFAVACLPSPPTSGSEKEVKREKRPKRTKKPKYEEDSSEFDDLVRSRKYTVPMNTAADAPPQAAQGHENTTAHSQSESSEANRDNMGTGSDAGGTPGGAPTNRRGRKQSLTDDPSKTFKCELCNRRFRRQEHLKRHYRSLHTEDKPFQCKECGKQFSRSDNLSQHSRTHGAGAFVMNVLEDGELPPDHESDSERLSNLGGILFSVAADASGSDSSSEPASGGDEKTRKKRKRSN